MTTMTSDVNNIQLGACSVTFAGNLMGLTKGGVEVTISTTTYQITTDQYGGSPVNEYITSRTCSVKAPFSESTMDRYKIMIPGSVVVTDSVDVTKQKLVGSSATGLSLRNVSDTLILHPLNQTTKQQDFVVPICSPKGDITFSYKHDAERIYSVEFMGYPDLATGTLFIIGDPSADGTPVTQAPSFTQDPTISGTAEVNQTLTGSDGTIFKGVVSARQWYRSSTAISGATTTTYQLVTADIGQTITYAVTASNSVGNTTHSSAATAAVLGAPTVPAAPTISAQFGPEQVTVTITNGSTGGRPITSYNVYRGTAAGGEAFVRTVTSSPFTDTALVDGQAYYYKVTAVNVIGESLQSNEVFATPSALPNAPTISGVTAGATQNSVAYTDGSANGSTITKHIIYRGLSAGSETVYNNNYTGTSPFVDTGLTNGQAYYYKISAFNTAGEGAKSNEATGTPVDVPTAPTITVTRGATQNVITLTDGSTNGSAITSHKLYKATTAGGETTGTVVTFPYTDTGLTNGTTYYYKATAINGVGESVKSVEASGTPADVPSAPTINSITFGDSQNTLNFTDGSTNGSAITGHKLYRGTATGTETLIGTIGTGSPYIDMSLTNGTTYYYYIKSTNALGDSVQSNEMSATPAKVPAAPTISILAGTSSNSVSFTDGATNGAAITKHIIYRGTAAGAETPYNSNYTGTSPFVDSTVTAGTLYYYKVAAVNVAGTSAQSNEVAGNPGAIAIPGSPFLWIDAANTTANPAVANGATYQTLTDSINGIQFTAAGTGTSATYVTNHINGIAAWNTAGLALHTLANDTNNLVTGAHASTQGMTQVMVVDNVTQTLANYGIVYSANSNVALGGLWANANRVGSTGSNTASVSGTGGAGYATQSFNIVVITNQTTIYGGSASSSITYAYVNGSCVGSIGNTSITSNQTPTLFNKSGGNSSTAFKGNLMLYGMYSSVLSLKDVVQLTRSLWQKYGIADPISSRGVTDIYHGNSRFNGDLEGKQPAASQLLGSHGGGSWDNATPARCASYMGAALGTWHNYSVDGLYLGTTNTGSAQYGHTMLDHAGEIDALVTYLNSYGVRSRVVIGDDINANILGNMPVATMKGFIQSYASGRKSANSNVKIIAMTPFDSNLYSMLALAQEYQADLAAGLGVDILIDAAKDNTLGINGTAGRTYPPASSGTGGVYPVTPYWADGVHFLYAGYDYAAQVLYPGIASV